MKKKKDQTVKVILWALSVIWLLIVIWESSETGAATANTSYHVASFFASLFHLPESMLAQTDHFLRTMMHFINFFVLGGLVYSASHVTWLYKKYLTFWIIGVCSVIAILDEVKKVYIIGRHLSWPEAGLNCFGVLAGVLLIKFSFWLVKYNKQQR